GRDSGLISEGATRWVYNYAAMSGSRRVMNVNVEHTDYGRELDHLRAGEALRELVSGGNQPRVTRLVNDVGSGPILNACGPHAFVDECPDFFRGEIGRGEAHRHRKERSDVHKTHA